MIKNNFVKLVVLAFFAFAFSGCEVKEKVENLEEKVSKLEQKIEKLEHDFNKTKEQSGSIQRMFE